MSRHTHIDMEKDDMNDRKQEEIATIDVVFDGPPAHEAGRFVEVENSDGSSIGVGKWVERDDGLWALRMTDPRLVEVLLEALEALCDRGNARSWDLARAAIAKARGEAE